MSKATLFPSPAEVETRTPQGRDRAIDVIRITALIGVVFGHTIMATSIIRDDVFIWSNLLTESMVLQALTWIFQIMPLFFSPASPPLCSRGGPATVGATG